MAAAVVDGHFLRGLPFEPLIEGMALALAMGWG